jgi:hypothetical protein
LKKLIISLKFHVHMVFIKVNLVGYTCMYDFELQNKCPMARFE